MESRTLTSSLRSDVTHAGVIIKHNLSNFIWMRGGLAADTEHSTKMDYFEGQVLSNPSMTITNGHCEVVQHQEFLFKRLVVQWHSERGATSSITKMAMCPSYQRIIAMGKDVIPLLLRQLEIEGDEPDMWFWALRVLTNDDPITDDIRGDIVQMAQAWLNWGRTRYAW